MRLLQICAILAALQPVTARAWEQSMTCGVDQSCAEGQMPQPAHWKTPCVSFHLNESGTKQMEIDTIEEITRISIDTWNRPDVSSLALHYSGRTNETRIGYNPYIKQNANIIVFRDEGWDESREIMALTTVTHRDSDGLIFDADIEVNTTYWKFGDVDTDGQSIIDLQNTLTHEIGHTFGLSHSAVDGATMSPSSSPGDTRLRTLDEDDLAAIAAIYPPNASTKACKFKDGYFERPPYEMDEKPDSDSCSALPARGGAPGIWVFALLCLAAAAVWRRRPS